MGCSKESNFLRAGQELLGSLVTPRVAFCAPKNLLNDESSQTVSNKSNMATVLSRVPQEGVPIYYCHDP